MYVFAIRILDLEAFQNLGCEDREITVPRMKRMGGR